MRVCVHVCMGMPACVHMCLLNESGGFQFSLDLSNLCLIYRLVFSLLLSK